MLKRKLGISIYPEHAPLAEIYEYLKLAHKYEYEILFVSFVHFAEDSTKDNTIQINETIQAIKYAHELGFYVITDISLRTLKMLDIKITDLKKIKEMGVACIRFDSPASAMTLANLTHNQYGLDVQLNMSGNDYLVDDILSYQPIIPRLSGCHNFYAQKNTGLTFDFFQKCNQKYITRKLETTAFIGSHVGNQGPSSTNKDMTTLEELRYLSCATQAKFLFYTNEIDNVIFGNAFATEAELKAVAEIDKYEIILKVHPCDDNSEVEMKILDFKKHARREESTDLLIRSSMSRYYFKKEAIKPKKTPTKFNQGDVVVINEQGGSYQGEMHIILQDNYEHQDNFYNLIGKIDPDQLPLLRFIHGWSAFKLEISKTES
ncbi:MupG family TIM beta-alpha barrel fold protein [Williamsoniiplasma lucivorax]|uniref:Outer surface protein n=1 Tax=Williamsoniiplasma lucivorax TaxID=209274 RepID=A0A2S5RE41_9MOLU|nr:MupG family TIM beta-alpha barrel fold protein [Williamsoniiplasma lucivorax]PPE05482.1 hypothetical protein ELUCI_v1c05750 [Williamsoniiplasma lucivorax]